MNIVNENDCDIDCMADESNTTAKSYKSIEKGNENIQKEVKYLKIKNQKLEQDNNRSTDYIKAILDAIKDFLEIYYKLAIKTLKIEQ